MEVLSAQFILGVQIGQEITTGVSRARRPEYILGADRLGVWVTFQSKKTLIPWSNISYMVCREFEELNAEEKKATGTHTQDIEEHSTPD